MKQLITLIILSIPLSSVAYDSGSTGVDGAFNPTADVELQLSPSGIFNFTTVNIPADVTVTFAKNTENTPVTILASGDVTINGTIFLNGGNTANTNDADVTGDGLPGIGGPGGFDGGHGGYSGTDNDGGHGQGPGGADSGRDRESSGGPRWGCGGAGAGYNGNGVNFTDSSCAYKPQGGSTYGINALIPLLGGSGGGGGAGIPARFGSAGGGGGGAILMASSDTMSISGTVSANGGSSGQTVTSSGISRCSGSGGGGSGGAIRIIATTLSGTGNITANGGAGFSGTSLFNQCKGKNGAPGRIRLETENMQFTPQTSPDFSFAGPSPVFVPNLPSISFTSVDGIVAPGTPTGTNDIVLPENTPNPVEVVLATTDIPTGGTIKLTATPASGPAISVDSSPIAADGSATVSINLPNGPSTLIASTTFTVTASLGNDYSRYARGEQVEKVRVGLNPKGRSETTFITVSGKEFSWPSNAIAMN